MASKEDLTKDLHVVGCKGCCVYPNGTQLGIPAVILSVVSLILGFFAAFTCQYFSVEERISRFYGLFSLKPSYSDSCVSYSSSSAFPGSWKFAKAMAIIGTITGVIAFGFAVSISCVSFPNTVLKGTAILYLISALCLILTLVAKADCDNATGWTCKVGPGAALAIVTPFLYLGMAVILYKIPLYEPDDVVAKPVEGTQTTTTTVTQLPDGSKKTVKTTIDEHGNKTIEETIEAPLPEKQSPDEEIERTVLPDGSVKTTRTYVDSDGSKVVEETIEQNTKTTYEEEHAA